MSTQRQLIARHVKLYGRVAFYGALWGGAFGLGAVAARRLIHGSQSD